MQVVRVFAAAAALLWAAPATATDIADYFRSYYTRVQLSAHKSILDFLNGSAEQILTASPTRKVIVDQANGYLQISDSAGTDQVLTMALYRKANGGELLVVGSSNCADACAFSVGFFSLASDGLAAVSRDAVLPPVDAARFIKPGQSGPRAVPTINYVPARVGTSLTLKPWYGYEIEEQMDKKTRAALQDVVLNWDRANGRFR